MATYYFELIEEGGTVYVVQRNELSFVCSGGTGSTIVQQLASPDKYRWLFHPGALKDTRFAVEVLDVIKLPMPSGYPVDPVYGEVGHVDLVYNPNGILAPDGKSYPLWVAYLPSPNAEVPEDFSNPCVAYSTDGITWFSDFALPLVKPSNDYYNSSPELFELDDGRLCLINRQYSESTSNLQFMIYTPGSGWSNLVTYASSNDDTFGSLSVVKDASCKDREFVLFTTRDDGTLVRRQLSFSEDYSSLTVGDPVVCNVIDIDADPSTEFGGITVRSVNIRFINNQYVGIFSDGFLLYLTVSFDGYSFYAKYITSADLVSAVGGVGRPDFIIQEDGTILLYLPYSFGLHQPTPLLLIRVLPMSVGDPRLVLQPVTFPPMAEFSIFGVSEAQPGYQDGDVVHYYMSLVDMSGRESHKVYLGKYTSSTRFNVEITTSTSVYPGYRYRLYRSYYSSSMLNITDVYRDLLGSDSIAVDDNSNWISISKTTIAGTGGKVLGYDNTDNYVFTNKGIKVGETTRPPFVVESALLVQNLNADLLDGYHATDFASLIGDNVFTGLNTFMRSVTLPIAYINFSLELDDGFYTVLVDTRGLEIDITLPNAYSANGRIYVIKKIDPTETGYVKVSTQSGQYIDGVDSFRLATQYETIVVQAYRGNWYIIGYYKRAGQ